MCDQCTRREFLQTSVAASLMLSGAALGYARAADVPPQPRRKARISVIFTGAPGPADRGWNADASQFEAMKARLSKAERDLGNVELLIGQSQSAEETAALLQKAGPKTPVLAINLNIFAMTRVVQPILAGGHPTVVFSLPASGHDWMYAHRWQRQGKPVTLFPTSDYNELERALRLLRVPELMRQTRILLFPPAQGTAPARSPDEVKKRLGADVVIVDEKAFSEMIDGADAAAVRAEAEQWTKGAKEILEPKPDDIAKAARVSVALQKLVEKERAQGLAIGTCMGWLSKGFPCLGFARLRDAGIPAACEGDMDSLLTMLIFQHAIERAGFQGNATFDTSRNVLWTAHCTAPLKMEGVHSQPAPYLLRGHSEVGGSGCVPEVLYRVGQTITRTKFVNLETLLISTGKIVEVPSKSVRACRTQIVTEVRDAAAMAANWSSAIDSEDAMTLLHRVVFYDDQMDNARHLTRLMGLKLVEEG